MLHPPMSLLVCTPIPKKSDSKHFGFCFHHHICLLAILVENETASFTEETPCSTIQGQLLTVVIYKKRNFLGTTLSSSSPSVFACTKVSCYA